MTEKREIFEDRWLPCFATKLDVLFDGHVSIGVFWRFTSRLAAAFGNERRLQRVQRLHR